MVLFLFLIIILLQTSIVQNYAADFIIEQINNRTRQTAKVTKIRIKWFDFVEIKGLQVLDYQNEVMVEARNLSIDYELSSLIKDGNLFFDLVYLQEGGVYVKKYQDSLGVNLVEFLRDLNHLNATLRDSTKKKAKELFVNKVRLDQFNFSYENHLADSLPSGKFDYNHFLLELPGATFSNFKLSNDTILAGIQSLAARDPTSGFNVERLKAKLQLSNSGLDLDGLELETSNSLIRNRISLRYSGLNDLSYFVDSVSFDFQLEGSRISKKDLDYFVDIPAEVFSLEIDARIYGTVPKLSIEQLQMHIGDSHINGDIDFSGLPRVNETFIDARIKDSDVWLNDIDPFVGTISKDLKKLREIGFSGRFLGFTYDFVANGDFQTALGDLSSDINLKFPSGLEYAKYSGKLVLDGFEVGTMIGDTSLVGQLNLNGTIDGEGLTRRSSSFYLNAYLVNSEFLNYRFEEINANGQFASDFFKGELEVIDPNCTISTRGSIDLKSQPEIINVRSHVDQLNLMELGFMRDDFQFKGNVTADLTGLHMDSLQGAVNLKDIEVLWKGDSLKLDSVVVSSTTRGTLRNIAMDLPELSLELNGDFLFSQIVKDIKSIADELADYFNPDFNRDVFSNVGQVNRYSIDFLLSYKDPSPYTDLLGDDFYISPNGKLEGTYFQRENATLSGYSEIDSLHYKGVGYKTNTIDLNISKDLDSQGIIALAYVNSEKQYWQSVVPTENLSLEAVWFNNTINFNSTIDQPKNNSSANVNGEMKILEDRLIFTFLPSKLMTAGEQWHFNPYNKIVFTENQIALDRVELYKKDQSILLTGTYSDSTETNLNLVMKEFDLKALKGMLPVELFGTVNSSIQMTRKDYKNTFMLNSDLGIADFGLNEFLIGDIVGSTDWDATWKRLNVDLNVLRDSVNIIAVVGDYVPLDTVNQLDIKADFNQANLQLLNPFLGFVFSDIGGVADGSIVLTGDFSNPVLNGFASITEGKFKFDYLGTNYSFDGRMTFDNEAINFEEIRLKDRDGDQALMNGAIYHQSFSNLTSDLSLVAKDFQFLNTVSEDNNLFYGTAKASGTIEIKGPFEDLLIAAKAKTEKGTKIYIPLADGDEGATKKDYISFIDFADPTHVVNIEEIVRQRISGIRLDFDIDVTPDAYVELIFDIRTGDIIRGRGVGTLNLSLDTNGEFELFGDLSILEGAYNFTIPAIGISKEFTITPGSTISWYGDPYSAMLNLKASYRQLASFNDFSPPATGEETVAQKYSVLVVLGLSGEMMSPAIDFEIKLEDSQSSPTMEVQQALSTINGNEQELKRQVFSLLILRKFSPRASFNVSGGNAIGGSLSEFLSNQFSYFISQVDENLQVDVDLPSLDADAFNIFQLRLSYTFLDGRLRVSGGGAFPQSSSNGSSTTQASNFVGDWSVRYLLTPDGHLRVRAFSQTEQIANQQQRETGVSFQYIKSFNDLKELLTKTREESIQSPSEKVNAEGVSN